MSKILCSTGALITRCNNRDHRLLPKIAEGLMCDGFEFMIYDSFYENIDHIADDLVSYGLSYPVFHCEKKIGELIAGGNEEAFGKFEINCRTAVKIGAEILVLHLWNGMISDSRLELNLGAYSRLAEISEYYGLTLTVENVICNCNTPYDDLVELALRYPSVKFTLDTKMAEFHGELHRFYDEKLWKNHIRHLHINDYSGGVKEWQNLRTLHLGEGHVNFEEFFSFVRRIGYDGYYTVEASSVATDGSVDITKLNKDFNKIKSYIA